MSSSSSSPHLLPPLIFSKTATAATAGKTKKKLLAGDARCHSLAHSQARACVLRRHRTRRRRARVSRPSRCCPASARASYRVGLAEPPPGSRARVLLWLLRTRRRPRHRRRARNGGSDQSCPSPCCARAGHAQAVQAPPGHACPAQPRVPVRSAPLGRAPAKHSAAPGRARRSASLTPLRAQALPNAGCALPSSFPNARAFPDVVDSHAMSCNSMDPGRFSSTGAPAAGQCSPPRLLLLQIRGSRRPRPVSAMATASAGAWSSAPPWPGAPPAMAARR